MRGYPLFNFPAFDEATARARAAGWHAISPADMDREVGFDEKRDSLSGFDMDAAMDRDIAAIRSLSAEAGDALALLPGWERSVGAQGELGLARWMGLRILDAVTLEDLRSSGSHLPQDPVARKLIPLGTGVVDYFPLALIAVAECSRKGNDQHNPGKPLHWDRAKSGDESDALMRHFVERGRVDTDGIRHSTKVAWRALALLQKEIEGTAIA
jgi:hypothetical protein